MSKYNWDDFEPILEGLGPFWFGMLVGALLEAGLIIVCAFIFWVLW